MHHWLNKGHCQFDLVFLNFHQVVIGKMISFDHAGCTILLENNGEEHAYSWSVIQHICLAP